ncbi:hypothetical protein PENSPDRAFT_594537, partial [Peniophora sp. CONT]
MNLKDEPLRAVYGLDSSHDIWTRLKERYRGKGYQRAAQIMSELFRGTLAADSPLEPQLNDMIIKSRTLKDLGVPLPDAILVIGMTISLPAQYDTLK